MKLTLQNSSNAQTIGWDGSLSVEDEIDPEGDLRIEVRKPARDGNLFGKVEAVYIDRYSVTALRDHLNEILGSQPESDTLADRVAELAEALEAVKARLPEPAPAEYHGYKVGDEIALDYLPEERYTVVERPTDPSVYGYEERYIPVQDDNGAPDGLVPSGVVPYVAPPAKQEVFGLGTPTGPADDWNKAAVKLAAEGGLVVVFTYQKSTYDPAEVRRVRIEDDSPYYYSNSFTGVDLDRSGFRQFRYDRVVGYVQVTEVES